MPVVAETLNIVVEGTGELPVACPAGTPIAGVRGVGRKAGAEVPGVLCRIVHEPIDLLSDPMSPGVFCCHPDQGHRLCPVWQFDKDLIGRGFKSMGDAAVMNEENDAALREDLTGSRYGDLGFLEALEESAREARLSMMDDEGDGFVRGEG